MQTTLIDLATDYGLIEISGPDAYSFLQGQLTCDMREITPTTHKLGAYCNIKGRVRALFRIFIQNEHYYLLLPHSILPNTVTQLKKYGLFSKVTIKIASLHWQCLGIIGNLSSDLLESLDPAIICLPIPEEAKFKSPRFILVSPTSQRESLFTALANHTKSADFETWKLSDIRAGLPQVGLEITEQFLPHDLNLPALNAVSFSKGCYCGQEIIARMEYRAKLKRHLYKGYLEQDTNIPIPAPGTKLFIEQYPEEDAGTVILASLNSDNIIEMLIETLDQYVQNKIPLYLKNV